MEAKRTSYLETQTTRRKLLKKAAYVTPLLLTLPAVPALAATGSQKPKTKKPKPKKKPK